MKLWEVLWHGGGGSGYYIRIVAANDAIEAVEVVFKGSPFGRIATAKELIMPDTPGIMAEYDFENEDYDG